MAHEILDERRTSAKPPCGTNDGSHTVTALRPPSSVSFALPSVVRPPSNIILAGFMGTGKTAVGRALAERLGRPFLDMDDEIQARFGGMSIAQVFALHGEAAFRAVEAQICCELSVPRGLVVATGGGAVTFPDNRVALAAGGHLICLTARPATIIARVGERNDRPLLAGDDRAARIASLLAQRAPHYGAISWQVCTDDRTVDQIAGEICARLSEASLL